MGRKRRKGSCTHISTALNPCTTSLIGASLTVIATYICLVDQAVQVRLRPTLSVTLTDIERRKVNSSTIKSKIRIKEILKIIYKA